MYVVQYADGSEPNWPFVRDSLFGVSLTTIMRRASQCRSGVHQHNDTVLIQTYLLKFSNHVKCDMFTGIFVEVLPEGYMYFNI